MARHRGRGRHGGVRPDPAGDAAQTDAAPADAAPADASSAESAAEGASEGVPAKRAAVEGGRRAAPRQREQGRPREPRPSREPGKPREPGQPRPPRQSSELQPAGGRPNSGRRQPGIGPRAPRAVGPRTNAPDLVAETSEAAEAAGTGEAAGAGEPCEARKGCTLAQMRRFIKSRPYVPLHELRRRFEIEGVEDEVHPIAAAKGTLFVGLPAREAGFLGELIQSGEVGYELLLDPVSPALVGVFPMRPVARQ